MVENNNFQTLSDLKKNFTTTTTATYANSIGGHTTDPVYPVFSFLGVLGGRNGWRLKIRQRRPSLVNFE